MSQLTIKDLMNNPTVIEVIDDSPAAGDQTIYTAYAEPRASGQSLANCVIKKMVVDVNTSPNQIITTQFAVSAADKEDQLTFNKAWDDRLTLTYKNLSY